MVYCKNCGYLEFYNKEFLIVGNILDLFFGGWFMYLSFNDFKYIMKVKWDVVYVICEIGCCKYFNNFYGVNYFVKYYG